MINDTEKRKIVRQEFESHFSSEFNGISTLENIRQAVDGLTIPGSVLTEEHALDVVDFLCSEGELPYGFLQDDLLEQVYGAEIQDWDDGKKHKTYVRLLGEELANMIHENSPAEVHKTLNDIIHKKLPESAAEGLMIENNYRLYAIRAYDAKSRSCVLERDEGEYFLVRGLPNQRGELKWDHSPEYIGKGSDALLHAKEALSGANKSGMKLE